jgi:hypothetical protein
MTRNERESSRAALGRNGNELVYRSGHLYEADWVANEMDRFGLPYYRATEQPLGVRFAMPAAPSMSVSCYWLVIVPASHAIAARAAIRRLPVSRQAYPGVWAFGPTERARLLFTGCAWLYLAGFAAGLLGSLLNLLRSLWSGA